VGWLHTVKGVCDMEESAGERHKIVAEAESGGAGQTRSAEQVSIVGLLVIAWRWKWLLLAGSVVPALVAAGVLASAPRWYKVTYLYDTGLTEKGYKTLLDKFYSAENMDRLAAKLADGGVGELGEEITTAREMGDLRKMVEFVVSPSYIEAINVIKPGDIDTLQKIQQASGTLLSMTITSRFDDKMPSISRVIRDNFEKVIPVYSMVQDLRRQIAQLKADMADIEEKRHDQELLLDRKRETLAKLQKLGPSGSDKLLGGIVLQFDTKGGMDYLPLAYQAEVVDANIVKLEERIRADQEKYAYCEKVLGVDERLLGQLSGKMASYYTVQEYHSFLNEVKEDYKEKELLDYLNAYIRRVENVIATNAPIVENPRTWPVARGGTKNVGIVFVIALMVSTFGAFLLEGASRYQAWFSRSRPGIRARS